MRRVLFALIFMSLMACNKDGVDPEIEDNDRARLSIKLQHVFNGKALNYDSSYVTSNGDVIKFSEFKYFLSNMTFIGVDGDQLLTDHYDLVSPANDTNVMFIEKSGLSEGHYSSLKVSIGVDPESNNTSLDAKGDLDPTGSNGMKDANLGYQFLKFGGTYSNNGDVGSFSYEIGEDDNYKVFHFLGVDDHTHESRTSSEGTLHIDLINDQTTTVHFIVELAELFASPAIIDVKKDIATSTTFMNNIHLSHVYGKTGWFQLHHNETE